MLNVSFAVSSVRLASIRSSFVGRLISKTALVFGLLTVLGTVVFVCNGTKASAQTAAVLQAPSSGYSTFIPDYSDVWFSASLSERQHFAERIGEAGARRFAESKGWRCILDPGQKGLRQGFDQIWTDGKTIHIIEAKGGNSMLQMGYGYKQGSAEWVVEAAKKLCSSKLATAAEKETALRVLRAAAEGKMQVWSIQTSHVLGKPGLPKLICSCSTSATAKKMAQKALLLASSAVTTKTMEKVGAKPSVQKTVPAPKAGSAGIRQNMTPTSLSGTTIASKAVSSSRFAKGAGVIGAAVDIGVRGIDVYQTEQDYRAGEIDSHERAKAHVKNGAGMVGGWGGAWAGASTGASVGAAAGSVVPGVGTAIGGAIGGMVGGAVGYIGGSTAAEAVVESGM